MRRRAPRRRNRLQDIDPAYPARRLWVYAIPPGRCPALLRLFLRTLPDPTGRVRRRWCNWHLSRCSSIFQWLRHLSNQSPGFPTRLLLCRRSGWSPSSIGFQSVPLRMSGYLLNLSAYLRMPMRRQMEPAMSGLRVRLNLPRTVRLQAVSPPHGNFAGGFYAGMIDNRFHKAILEGSYLPPFRRG